MKRIIALFMMTAMLLTAFSACGEKTAVDEFENAPRNESLAIWTTHSLDRVRKNRQPESTKDFELFAAKGE